jgi:outer membrane protein TolC
VTRIASPDERAWAGASAVFFGMAALLLGGCTVGPNYQRPSTDVPADYQESADFKAARPSDEIAKGKWWEVYGDPQLNALEEQVTVSNQTLKEAQAQFAEARAAITVNRAAYYPTVSASPSAAFSRASQTKALFGTTSPVTYAD